jgi:DNA polymerase III epsilon subunit-like protein
LGKQYPIDPFFTKLTGITEGNIPDAGVPLQEALAGFDRFSGGARA